MAIFLDMLGMADLHQISQAKFPDLFEKTDLNHRGFADALWFRKDGKTRQLEVKRGLEANPNQLIEQLQRQRPMADFTDLMIIGGVTEDEEGNCRKVGVKKNHTKQNYMWYRRELARFIDSGTMVYELPTPEDAVTQLVALYKNDQEPKDDIFDRLIVEKKYIDAEDERIRNLALQLMGLRAGIGKDIALALAGRYQSLAEIMHGLEATTDEYNGGYIMSQIKLPNGKRTVGPAKVAQLRKALGL